MMLLCPARVTHTCARCARELPPPVLYFRTPAYLLAGVSRRGAVSRGWTCLCGPCGAQVALPAPEQELRDLAAAGRLWYAPPAGTDQAGVLDQVAKWERRLEACVARLREHAADHPARGTEHGASQVHREIRDGKARLLRWSDRLAELAAEVGDLRRKAAEAVAQVRDLRAEEDRLFTFLELATGAEGRLAGPAADQAEEDALRVTWELGASRYAAYAALAAARRLVRAVAAELEAEYTVLETPAGSPRLAQSSAL